MSKFNIPKNSRFRTNREAEAHTGIEIELEPGMVFIVKRAGGANQKFVEALSKRKRPFRRQIDNDTMSIEDLRTKVLVPAYIDAVILGWAGEVFQDVEYNRKNAMEFFAEYPDVFSELSEQTTEAANWAMSNWEEAGESLGNSQSGA